LRDLSLEAYGVVRGLCRLGRGKPFEFTRSVKSLAAAIHSKKQIVTTRRMARSELLVITASLQGGSWRWIEEVVTAANLDRVTVLGYGSGRSRASTPKVVRLPFLSYERSGIWLDRHRVALVAYNFPLVLATYVAMLLCRPKAVMANGVLLTAACVPYALVTKAKLYLAYHGFSGHISQRIRKALVRWLSHVDRAFVNSVGSARDLSAIVDPERITTVEHWADEVFFSEPVREVDRRQRIQVLYVGRLDLEKTTLLLEVVRACQNDPIDFVFVGEGAWADRIARMADEGCSVRRLGYVFNQRTLAHIYGQADVLWGIADDTYVAKPVVEALAVGLPVIVPDVPGARRRAAAGFRVPHDLLPPEVGCIIDGTNSVRARDLLLSLKPTEPVRRRRCKAFARARYSRANLLPVREGLRSQ
jgi:glycosyltransferase involved in cell wall biosynthesis